MRHTVLVKESKLQDDMEYCKVRTGMQKKREEAVHPLPCSITNPFWIYNCFNFSMNRCILHSDGKT